MAWALDNVDGGIDDSRRVSFKLALRTAEQDWIAEGGQYEMV